MRAVKDFQEKLKIINESYNNRKKRNGRPMPCFIAYINTFKSKSLKIYRIK